MNGLTKISRWYGQPRVSRWLNTLAPLLLFLALTFAFFGRNVNWSKYYFGYSTDSLLFIWFLNWWPFAISHGLNPFICKYVWFPAGYNVTWATSVATLAILSWPVTMLGSPVLSYNILMLSAPALAAWTAFLLSRELTGNWTASLVCGLLFGFSGPELNQVAAELNLDSVVLIPLAVLLCVRRLRGRLNRWPFIILLSFLLVAQLGMSTEVLASLCVFGALTWAVFLLFAPATERKAFWRLALDIALAAPLVMVLAAPFLYYLVQGLPEFPTHIHPPVFQEDDLVQFVVPVIPIHSGRAALASIIKQLSGFRLDKYTFTSIPVLLMLAWYFYRQVGTAYVRALLASICLMAALTLGLKLLVNGHLTNVPMPWALFAYVPLVRSILPIRFLVYFTLGTAVSAALFLADAKTTAARLPRYALAGLACLFLPPARVEVMPMPWQTQPIFQPQTNFKWTLWPEHPFFTPEHIRQALGPLPNVILLPDPVVGPGMAWQINAGMNFTQAEGYVGYTLLHDRTWDVSDNFVWNSQSDFGQAFAAFAAVHRVDFVLIGPGTPPGIVGAIEALGWAHRMDEGIEIVQTPASMH